MRGREGERERGRERVMKYRNGAIEHRERGLREDAEEGATP